MTGSAYIRRNAVMELLSRECSLRRKTSSRSQDTGFKPQTLGETTRKAIEQTIDACGGNQTAAANRIGISRTTLWRYLSTKR